MTMALDDATFNAIIDGIADHGNARQALRDTNVNPKAFWAAIADDEERRKRYARAKQNRLHAMAEEMLEIADDGRNDTYVDDDGGKHLDQEWMQRSKLRVDTRKWLLAKLMPKVYGDKVTLAGDADNPLAIVDHTAIASKLLPELAARSSPTAPGDPDDA